MKRPCYALPLFLFINFLPTVLNAQSAFDGFYFGAKVGYELVRTSEQGSGLSQLGEIRHELSPFWGGYAGYGIRKTSFYFGLETDFNNANSYTTTSSHDYKLGKFYALSARVGIITSPQDIIYAKYGFLRRDVKTTGSVLGGYQYGGGFEHELNPHMLSRIEFMVMRYNDLSVSATESAHTYSGNLSVGLAYDF